MLHKHRITSAAIAALIAFGSATLPRAQAADAPEAPDVLPPRTITFECVEPADCPKEITKSVKPLPWSYGDKVAVRNAFLTILAKQPALPYVAAHGHNLRFYRAATASSEALGGSSPSALNTPQGIIITNTFFRWHHSSQAQGLAHEMTHSADCVYRIAYSREWVKFVEPALSNQRCLRAMSELALTPEPLPVPSTSWPSVYGTTNLIEALAEFMAWTTTHGKNYIRHGNEFMTLFGDRLLKPTATDFEFAKHHMRGHEALYEGDHQTALRELQRAAEIAPSTAMIWGAIGSAYSHDKQYDKAIENLQKCLKLMDAAGVPQSEGQRNWCHEALGYCFYRQNSWEQARAELTTVLRFGYSERNRLLSYRAYCNHQLGDLDATASDLLAISQPAPLVHKIIAAGAEAEHTLKVLDYAREHDPTRWRVLRLKSEYEQYLGDVATRPADQQRYYRNALRDIEACVDAPGCDKARALVACGRLHLLLHDRERARNLCDYALRVDRNCVEADILSLSLSRDSVSKDELQRQFAAVKEKILHHGFEVRPKWDDKQELRTIG